MKTAIKLVLTELFREGVTKAVEKWKARRAKKKAKKAKTETPEPVIETTKTEFPDGMVWKMTDVSGWKQAYTIGVTRVLGAHYDFPNDLVTDKSIGLCDPCNWAKNDPSFNPKKSGIIGNVCIIFLWKGVWYAATHHYLPFGRTRDAWRNGALNIPREVTKDPDATMVSGDIVGVFVTTNVRTSVRNTRNGVKWEARSDVSWMVVP